MSGWGADLWGAGSFGGGVGVGFMQIRGVGVVAENRIRIEFSLPLRLNRTFVAGDAARPGVFAVEPVPGTLDPENQPPRPVRIVAVERPPITDMTTAEAQPFADLILDRPLSGFPGVYELRILASVFSQAGDELPTGSAYFPGLDLLSTSPATAEDVSNVDFATTPSVDLLGTISVGDEGDYDLDDPIAGFKARAIRRAVVRPAGFAWAPTYGLGLPDYVKRLARSKTLVDLAVSAEREFSKDPAAKKVAVTFSRPTPNVLKMVLDATLVDGKTRRITASILSP
jgi:hypothetical protein